MSHADRILVIVAREDARSEFRKLLHDRYAPTITEAGLAQERSEILRAKQPKANVTPAYPKPR